jgi:hypothetical protein
MFFPVLLIGDFGWWAWLVFALPNVIGATSVGLVLRRPGAAARFAAEHRVAMGWFAAVTVAFQVYAAAWLIRETLGGRPADLLPAGPLRDLSVTLGMTLFFLLVGLFALAPFRLATRVAIGVIAVSLTTFALAGLGLGVTPGAGAAFVLPPAPDDTLTAALGLAAVAPVIAAGFLLCPYLDPTINRVRQETAEPAGSYAFAFGFGGPFLLMILGTLAYAGFWLREGALPLVIVVHVIVQAAFTAGVHLRALFAGALLRSSRVRGQGRRTTPRLVAWRVFLAVFVILIMGPLGNAAPDFGNLRPGYSITRLGYETFMLMYGVVFPLAMWCFAITPGPLRDTSPRRRRIAFVAALGFALPLVGVGYVWQTWWLATIGIVGSGVIAIATPNSFRRDARDRQQNETTD